MGKRQASLKRPMPPEMDRAFLPAPAVLAWIEAEVLSETGAIHNPAHKHLIGADLAVLWADTGYETKGRTVVGTAEQVAFRCSAWQRLRQEQQMLEWFGRVPDFVITFAASYAEACDDVAWCALVEHELYHVAQQTDGFGAPAFTRDGNPKLCIRGHDVEEFVGVVERYGVGAPDGALARLVRAANAGPKLARSAIAGACGTCLRLVA